MKITSIIALLLVALSSGGCGDSALEHVLVPVAPVPGSVSRYSDVDYQSASFDDGVYRQPGQYTIIYYHWAQCPACRVLNRNLPRFLKLREDVVVRRIRLADDWSRQQALRDFKRDIGATPFIIVFGADGKLVAADEGMSRQGSDLLYDWMKHEADKQWRDSDPSMKERLLKWLYYG